jgi:hypothetical protein
MKVCKRHPGGPKELPDIDFYEKSAVCKLCKYAERMSSPEWKIENRKRNHSMVSKWHNTRNGAERRGIVFDLTKEDFAKILEQPCAYGDWVHGDRHHVGVDRMDNSIGYTGDNCVSCCGRHNSIKGDWASYEDMRELVKAFPSARACGSRGGRKCQALN